MILICNGLNILEVIDDYVIWDISRFANAGDNDYELWEFSQIILSCRGRVDKLPGKLPDLEHLYSSQ